MKNERKPLVNKEKIFLEKFFLRRFYLKNRCNFGPRMATNGHEEYSHAKALRRGGEEVESYKLKGRIEHGFARIDTDRHGFSILGTEEE